MDRDTVEQLLADDRLLGSVPEGAHTGSAGGAPCGDLVRVSLTISAGRIDSVSLAAEGCAPSRAAAVAAGELAEGAAVLEAALISPASIAERLGGLAATHAHAAELAADALHRALGAAAGSSAPLAAAPADSGERVLVALSGGVDSAVAALLERERGADVVAVTLKLWADRATDGERSCCSPEAVVRARRVAHSLGIPHLTLDLEDSFRAAVVGPFIEGHRNGATPNPCVLCNGELRLDAMIALADRVGASALATGHYARIADDGSGPLLARPADPAKDQTYMLSGLRPVSLGRLRFPLGALTKPEVRAAAADAGLEVADRAESQDLCFLAGQGKRSFLERHAGLPDAEGAIVNSAGERLGSHHGHHNFTVGQRRGLGVGGGAEPLYVLGTDAGSNRVTVGPRRDLQRTKVRLRETRLHRDAARVSSVRLRYHAPERRCELADHDSRGDATLALAEPADAVAPGQVACLMDGDLVVGHGTIAGSA